MIIDDPHRWTGDTPTPCASTSESSVSTLTVDDSIVLTKRGVGEAFESTYWSTIRESRGQDFEDDYEIRYEQEQGEKQDKEQPLENLDLVEVSLDDESGPRIECISPHQGITKHIRKWWGSNVSMVIPDDQELRDHFCKFLHFSTWSTVLCRRTSCLHFGSERPSFRKDLSGILSDSNVARDDLCDALSILHLLDAYCRSASAGFSRRGEAIGLLMFRYRRNRHHYRRCEISARAKCNA